MNRLQFLKSLAAGAISIPFVRKIDWSKKAIPEQPKCTECTEIEMHLRDFLKEENWRVDRTFTEQEIDFLVGVTKDAEKPREALQSGLDSLGIQNRTFEEMKRVNPERMKYAICS